MKPFHRNRSRTFATSCPVVAGLLLFGCLFTAAKAEESDPSHATIKQRSPWDLEQLRKAPSFEWVDTTRPVHSLIYTSVPYGGRATRTFAYYASPATLNIKEKLTARYPAIVLAHGGGGTAFEEWAEKWARRGYAAIAMDLAGHRPIPGTNAHKHENRTQLESGGPNHRDEDKFLAIDQPLTEQWPYHAVANVILAHSLIRSFPETDIERTAITGISWGGYLTCIAAGLDSRFKAAVPVYGCGFIHENSKWLHRFAAMTEDQRQRWIESWDPSNYLPSVSMPILFMNGTNDGAYPLDSYMKSYDIVPSEKQLCVTVNMPHNHPDGWAPLEIGRFIDQHLLQGPKLPKLDLPRIEGSQVLIPWKKGSGVTSSSLHYTTDKNAINQRRWTTIPATLKASSAVVSVPPPSATAWFVTVKQEDGSVISSRIFIR